MRPDTSKLAQEMLRIKDSEIEKYNSINAEFSELFPNVSFDAQLPKNYKINGYTRELPQIMIEEKFSFGNTNISTN